MTHQLKSQTRNSITPVQIDIQHCRLKAVVVMQAETQASLEAEASWKWQKTSRAEMHVYNIRHIQHHAAQLILRLRLDHSIEMPWISSGWGND